MIHDHMVHGGVGTNARLRTKQHLLDLLLERARDEISYTRSAVCKAWETLAQGGGDGAGRIPIGHWLPVTRLAVGASAARPPSAPHMSCTHSYSSRVFISALV